MQQGKRNQPKKKTQKKPKGLMAPLAPELKHYVTGNNLIALDTGPSSTNPALYHITSLNNIAQGDGQTDRTGIKIQARRLQGRFKFAVDPNSSSTFSDIVSDAHLFRLLVIQDTNPNGATPSWTDVMQTYITNAGQEYDWKNPWFDRRFKFLIDKFIRVPPSYVIYDGSNYHALGNFKFFEFDLPLNADIWFSDNTSNVSAIQSNNFTVFVASDATTSAYPQMKFSCRLTLRYQDY